MAFKQYTFNGASAAGAITLTGAVVGQRVVAVIGHTRGGHPIAPVVSTAFETRITVADQIQQAGTGLQDYEYLVILETQDVAAVAAAGSVQGDAAALSEGLNVVSAADATKGVILPAGAVGKEVWVKNNAAAVLKVYPATGGAINAVAANGAFSMASLTACLFKASATGQWYTFPLVAS